MDSNVTQYLLKIHNSITMKHQCLVSINSHSKQTATNSKGCATVLRNHL